MSNALLRSIEQANIGLPIVYYNDLLQCLSPKYTVHIDVLDLACKPKCSSYVTSLSLYRYTNDKPIKPL